MSTQPRWHQWAQRLMVGNLVLWAVWVVMTPPDEPGQPLWDAIHAAEHSACFDCSRYVLLGRGVDEPLAIVSVGNLLSAANKIPLEVATLPYDPAEARRVREVTPWLFAILAVGQWMLVAYLGENGWRRWTARKVRRRTTPSSRINV